MVPGFLGILKSRSALAELRCATGGFEAVLLSFLHSRVTSEETFLLEKSSVRIISEEKGSGNAVTDSACLTGNTAACSCANYIEFALS